MSLRVRLIAAMVTVLALVIVGGLVLVRSQRAFLISQVDEQLTAARPFARVPNRPVGMLDPAISAAPVAPEAPISRLFVGIVDQEQLLPLLQGQLIDDVPLVTTDSDELTALTANPSTVDGSANGVRFRIAVSDLPDSSAFLIVALPLDEVDSAIRRAPTRTRHDGTRSYWRRSPLLCGGWNGSASIRFAE
ncbi:MAG: hypothetical protein R2710_08105 [Acidimicrobiales bacterium]